MQDDYKDTQIGIVPNNWKILQTQEIGKIVTGTTPSTKRPEYYGGYYPFITPTDISDKKYIDNVERYLTEKGYNVSRPLPPNSVVVTCIASIGKNAITTVESCTNQQINSIICNKVNNPEYIYYILSYKKQQLKALSGKTSVPIVNKGEFSTFLIPVPPHPEQKKIATILSTVDKAIEKTTTIIDKTKRLKKGLMQRLLTKGIGHEEFKETVLGTVPVKWTLKPICETGDIITGTTPSTNNQEYYGGKYNLVGPGDLDNTKYILNSEKKLSKKGFNKTRDLPEGAILVTCIGATIGKTGIAGKELSTNQQINSIICNSQNNNEYVYYSIKYHFRRYKSYISNQAVPIINKTTFSNLLLPLPPLPEQKQIAAILTSVDNKIQKEQEYKQQLQQLKKGLMQQLLTGKKRVQV